MSTTLGAVIVAARDKHPAFHPTRVTNAVFARFLSDWQNEMIGKAVLRDKSYLAQSMGIAISLSGANAPGVVGAGTTGGLPGDFANGSLTVSEETAGGLLFPLRTVAAGGVVVLSGRVATSAASTSISSTGAARTTNQDALRLVVITDGKGKGQERAIISNTAEQWVISTGSDGKQWTTTPDATSIFNVIAPNISADETLGVVTNLPAVSSRTGYLVRLNAQGAPFLDYTQPLTVSVDRGVPFPIMLAPLGGTVRYNDTSDEPLIITSYGRRHSPPQMPVVYFMSGALYLCGNNQDWDGVASIELRYVPIAPVFTQLTDFFLVPDGARPAAVAAAVAFAAQRINGTEDIKLDVAGFTTNAEKAEDNYLRTLRIGQRGRVTTMRDGHDE